jgi:hypothetical protein
MRRLAKTATSALPPSDNKAGVRETVRWLRDQAG